MLRFRSHTASSPRLRSASDHSLLEAPPELLPAFVPGGFDSLKSYGQQKTGQSPVSLLSGGDGGSDRMLRFRSHTASSPRLRSASDHSLLEAPPELLPAFVPGGFDSLKSYGQQKTGQSPVSLLSGGDGGSDRMLRFRSHTASSPRLRSASDHSLLEAPPELLPAFVPGGFDSLKSYGQQKTGQSPVFLLSGGDGGNRTHVRKHFRRIFSERSQCFKIRRSKRPLTDSSLSYPVVPPCCRAFTRSYPV